MTGRTLRGLGASAGVAVGQAYVMAPEGAGHTDAKPRTNDPDEVARALAALAGVADELRAAASRLRDAGLPEEAEIVETSAAIADDPSLADAIEARAMTTSAGEAISDAIEHHARALAALPDAMLAARAADVREIGRRAARLLAGESRRPLPEGGAIVVARDLGPGEVAELDLDDGRIAGIALVEGSATSHAAIMARALGVPMVVALGVSGGAIADGETIVVDGDEGLVVASPDEAALGDARAAVRRSELLSRAHARSRTLPVETLDGHPVTLLCNASTAAEVRAGLAAGAAGVGLLRTELAFLDARSWPTEADHLVELMPPLALLAGRVATVRTLDFGADKTPAFLAGIATRGLALMLEHPDALASQLRAVVSSGADTRLRVLLPLVETAAEVATVRDLLRACLPADAPAPLLGAMIETPTAARNAAAIAAEVDFVSIGTNDLVATTLDLDREAPLASALSAAEPEVIRLVAATVRAAHAGGRTVEVCGEAGSEPALVALLVGLGVDELSVAPARVDVVRETVRSLEFAGARRMAHAALETDDARAALGLANELIGSGKRSDEGGKALDARGGVLA